MQSFARKDNLKAHIAIHDTSRSLFRCVYKQCGKVYSSKVSFKAHVALHDVEEGSLECSICHKLYDNSQSLAQHIRVHAGSYKGKGIMEKKFKCQFCDKRFYASKDRERHLLTHTKEKNFECGICSMKFSRTDHLKRHRIKIHPDGQSKPSKSSRRQSKSEKEELAELSATEITRSIQQILAENNLPMDGPPVGALNPGTDLGVGSAQMTHMLNSDLHHRALLPSEQRPGPNTYLNISSNSGSHTSKHQVSSNWQHPAGDCNSMRYVVSGDTMAQADNGVAKYYITGDAVATYLLSSEASQTGAVNMDSIQRQSSLMMDSSHALPSDSLSNDFTPDGMKVLTGLTPIFLNSDGTTTDTDLIPMVYQSNPQ